MKMAESGFFDWQARFQTEVDCVKHLCDLRWPDGFRCPKCGHERSSFIQTRSLYQCLSCQHQTSVTAGTLFHNSRVPLLKWFWAMYWMGSDKGGISALHLSKLLEINWRTARLMQKKLRAAMGHRDSLYRLNGLIEVDDALVGGKRSGKRGRGAAGKTPVLLACESKGEQAGYLAMEAVISVNHQAVESFVKKTITQGQQVRSDALPALSIIDKTQQLDARVTPPTKVDEWLPWVHIAIGNMKTFLLGTFHGVSGKYLQEYLNEFCYRVVFKILCHFCNLVTKREMTHDQTSIRYGRSASSTQRR